MSILLRTSLFALALVGTVSAASAQEYTIYHDMSYGSEAPYEVTFDSIFEEINRLP